MTAGRKDEAARLNALRDRVARIGEDDWQLAAVGGEMSVVRPGMDGEPETLCVFTAAAGADEMALISDSLSTAGFCLGLIDRASAKIRELMPAKQKDYAAEAAMQCDRPAFQRFLEGLAPMDGDLSAASMQLEPKDRAATRLRSVLGVSSRRDLNIDPAAAERWRRLKSDYFNCLRGAPR